MKKTGAFKKDADFAGLRKKAESLLRENPPCDETPVSIEEARRLITELQTHQIELELQNEELRKAQERLAAEREKYADLYNFAPAAYFTLDERDVILDLNLMAAEMLGSERKYLVNRPITPYLTADSLQTFIASRAKALETGSPQTCELTLRPRGRVGQVHVQVNAAALQKPAGQKKQLWRAVMTDITDRKHAEEKLRRQAHLLENVKDAIISTDSDLRIREWNQAAEKLYGWSAEEVIGRNVDEVCGTRFIHETPGEARATLTRDKKWRGELRQHTRDGRPIWVAASITLLEDEKGRATGSATIASDITESKRAGDILQARMRIMEFASKNTLGATLQKALDEMCALSESPIGFFHFVEADQKTLSLQAWSTRTLEEMCSAEGKGRHYNIDEAGVWVDCVRERKAVIHNDYANLPHRKGMPEGHATVTREMVFPIIRGKKIAAIIGVGNKSTDYTQEDLDYISRLADLIWDITEHKRADEDRKIKDRAMETSINGIAISDLNERLIYINPALLAMWGYSSPAEVLGRQATEFWKPANPPGQVMQTLKKTGNWIGELVGIRKDGETFNAQVSASVVADENGQPNFMLASFLDITEKKRAEEQLKKLSRAVEQSQISVVITDPEGNIEYVNPKFCEITGYTSEEVEGRNPRFLKAEGKSSEEYAELWRTIKTGGEWRGEFHNKKKNGEPFWESTIISPIKNERGDITHFVAVKENITERKRMEEELRESEARYRRLVETAPAVLYTFSDKRGGIYYSPLVETLLGYPLEYLYSRPFLWRESIHPDDLPTVRAAVSRSSTEQPFDVEYRIRSAKGEWRWLLDRSLGQRVEGDELLIEGLAIDITELKLTQQALSESEQRYKSLFENNHAAILLIDPATRQIVDANPAARSYYGYSREQIAALKITDINTLSDERVSANMNLARQQEQNHFFFQHRLASGEIRDVEVYSGPIQVGGQNLLYSIVHDITERRRAERELEESHARLKATMDALPDLLFETDREGRIHDYHAAKPASLYVPPEKFLGKTAEEILPPEAALTIRAALERAEREGVVSGVVYSLPFENQSLWFEISVAAKEKDGRFIVLARDITERKRYQDALKQVNENLLAYVKEIESLQEQLREQAIRDVITGLFNRRYLQETLEREAARAQRANEPIGVIIMDVDRFKKINDAYGHKAGDLVLEKLGELLKTNLRAGDIPCRYGGEEFTIIMPGASLEDAARRAQSLLEKIAALRIFYEGREIRATVSMGVACFPLHGETGEQALICADKALYRAKETGRNKVVVYDKNLSVNFLDTNPATGVN